MFCKHCGHQAAEDSLFCPNCGNRLDSAQEAPPQTDAPYQQTPPSQPGSYPSYTPITPPPTSGYQPTGGYDASRNTTNFGGYSMRWYKFLIYFALFASCVLNALSGLSLVTGLIYGDSRELVYLVFGSLRVVDLLIGIAMIALAVFDIVVRQKLAHFRSNGPRFLLLLYVASIVVSLLYLILATAIVGDWILSSDTISQYATNTILSVVMILVNNIYFKKRASLFVN